jgi:hypothetical protein
MSNLRSTASGVIAALGFVLSATAGAQQRNVETVITQLSDAVTYSALAQEKPARPALTTYVGYLVSITNLGTNTLNSVYFTGASSIDGTRKAIFTPSDGSPCVQGATNTDVRCNFGQVRSQQTLEFVVFFETPLAPESPPSSPERVSFSGTTFFAEGTTDNPDAPNSRSDSNTESVTLGTNNPTRVRTGVRKPGGGLFTGNGAPTAESVAATFASLLTVPALPGTSSYGYAELCESRPNSPSAECSPLPAGAPACPLNISCLDYVDVTVTDKEGGSKLRFTPAAVTNAPTQYLFISLLRDSSVFKGSVNNARIFYLVEGDNPTWVEVFDCDKSAVDPLASVDRCIWDRRVYKNSDPEVKANPALAGDAAIGVIAKENGKFSW